MPGTGAKKITGRSAAGTLYEWRTTGAIDETSKPGFELFTGHRVAPGTPEATDAAMQVNDALLLDKKVEDVGT